VCFVLVAIVAMLLPSFGNSYPHLARAKIPSNLKEFHGPVWQAKPAAEKQQLLWAVVTQNETNQPWPSSFEKAQIFVEGMDETFDTVADDMPYDGAFDLFQRQKLIHSVGCISQIQFVITDNSLGYTGLFKSGADHAFLRFSTATEYDATPYSITPGLSFKFLRDGVPSSNFMSMYSLEGQASFNFFKHDLTNHVPNLSPNASYTLYLLGQKFLTASSFPTMLGLSDFATYDQSGNQTNSPNFPFRLVFQPSLKFKSIFPDAFTTSDLCSQLSTLSAPQPIYHIWAEPQPLATPVLIGYVQMMTSPTASLFGDQTLFFQHQRMEDDLAIFPQWTDSANNILNKQAETPYFNGFPDLPNNW